jgi:hypothetical protein
MFAQIPELAGVPRLDDIGLETQLYLDWTRAMYLNRPEIQRVLDVLKLGPIHPAYALAVMELSTIGMPELPVAYRFQNILEFIHQVYPADMRGFFVLQQLAKEEGTCTIGRSLYGEMFAQQAQAYLHSNVRDYGHDKALSEPILSDPDWDHKFVTDPGPLEQILAELVQSITWGKEVPDRNNGWSYFLPVFHDKKFAGTLYGIRIQIGATNTPGLQRLSVHVGYFCTPNDTVPYITKYRADFIPPLPKGSLDMRGSEFGLSIDAVRAEIVEHVVSPLNFKKVKVGFRVKSETIPRDATGAVVIRFPDKSKFEHLPEIEQKRYYLELATRALFYRSSLGFKLEIPEFVPIINPQEAQEIFEENPGLYVTFINKIRDSLLTNAGEAWKVMKQLGITQCSEQLASLGDGYEEIQGMLTQISEYNIERARQGIDVIDNRHAVFPNLIAWLQANGIEIPIEEDWLCLFSLLPVRKLK